MTNFIERESPQSSLRSQRTPLLVLGAVALIVIAFAVGFFVHPSSSADTTPAADSVDVGFAQDMTVHHNQAIDMATLAYTNASDPLVKGLAYDILTSQQNQVGQMQGWLALWDRAPLPTGGYMGWMTDHGDDHSAGGDTAMGDMAMSHDGPVATMPGMASSDDLARLRTATGQSVDVLFLQLMLRHHQGGLPMMEYGAEHAETAAVRNLSQTMVNTQTSEAELMTQMLTEKGAQPL